MICKLLNARVWEVPSEKHFLCLPLPTLMPHTPYTLFLLSFSHLLGSHQCKFAHVKQCVRHKYGPSHPFTFTSFLTSLKSLMYSKLAATINSSQTLYIQRAPFCHRFSAVKSACFSWVALDDGLILKSKCILFYMVSAKTDQGLGFLYWRRIKRI